VIKGPVESSARVWAPNKSVRRDLKTRCPRDFQGLSKSDKSYSTIIKKPHILVRLFFVRRNGAHTLGCKSPQGSKRRKVLSTERRLRIPIVGHPAPVLHKSPSCKPIAVCVKPAYIAIHICVCTIELHFFIHTKVKSNFVFLCTFSKTG
jgi:hypothetical protein